MYEILARLKGIEGRVDGYGIEHDLWIAFKDGEDEKTIKLHSVFPIPLAEFQTLVSTPANQRVEAYKTLLKTYWATTATPTDRDWETRNGV